MDTSKRIVLAIVLALAVIFGMQFLFPQKPQPKPASSADSATVHNPAGTAKASAETSRVDSTKAAAAISRAAAASVPAAVAETTIVAPVSARRDSGATFEMSNVGAAPGVVVMNTYANRVSGSNGAKVR